MPTSFSKSMVGINTSSRVLSPPSDRLRSFLGGPYIVGAHSSPITSMVLIVALIGPSGRSMAEISAKIGLTPPIWTQGKICFHSPCDTCPRGICPWDSASLFLADPGQFSMPILVVWSCGALIRQSRSLLPLSSSPWHSRIPLGSTMVPLGLLATATWPGEILPRNLPPSSSPTFRGRPPHHRPSSDQPWARWINGSGFSSSSRIHLDISSPFDSGSGPHLTDPKPPHLFHGFEWKEGGGSGISKVVPHPPWLCNTRER